MRCRSVGTICWLLGAMGMSKQEWEGGLPPVGVECEIRYLGYYNNNWMPFRATAITNDFVVGYLKSDRELAIKRKDPYVEFRPLKSKQGEPELCQECGECVLLSDYEARMAVLFDGYAVYSAMTEKAKQYTSPENVSAVLDAVVKLMREVKHDNQ